MESLNSSLIPKEGTVDGQKFIPLFKPSLLKNIDHAFINKGQTYAKKPIWAEEYLFDADGGGKKRKPGEVYAITDGFASEQAVDVNENHKRPYYPLIDGSPVPYEDITRNMGAPNGPRVYVLEGLPDAFTIPIKQDLNDPDPEYPLETDDGSKKGKRGKFKFLMAVGLTTGIFIVNMSLAKSGFPEHWILIGVFATLPPLLAIIKKAFSSNAFE